MAALGDRPIAALGFAFSLIRGARQMARVARSNSSSKPVVLDRGDTLLTHIDSFDPAAGAWERHRVTVALTAGTNVASVTSTGADGALRTQMVKPEIALQTLNRLGAPKVQFKEQES